mmetsp:Transcript_28799/g.112257  ORF Transcript_28799/g.112257 Transcript_28799/m.112257 type:complete len:391 (-) Transcript_28799:339-1511(-)|eukprot:CAMPEP_0113972054 /NCGR_PEP_ID=MMETSP0011_2-20120614/12900_1 /TAXON_ID=101924 /ORGANISM="Rhodosorus marinus" /LENGTH=390 /DNA_ID=CAMNT_0000988261 /DNA_START=100 /DNA_END=1272 /DNA_ORIENTATION=- /assembly_acc=CAM_ASM_000156
MGACLGKDDVPKKAPEKKSDVKVDTTAKAKEAAAEVETQIKAETSTETPAEVAVETPSETPAETPAEIAAETPAEPPGETLEEPPEAVDGNIEAGAEAVEGETAAVADSGAGDIPAGAEDDLADDLDAKPVDDVNELSLEARDTVEETVPAADAAMGSADAPRELGEAGAQVDGAAVIAASSGEGTPAADGPAAPAIGAEDADRRVSKRVRLKKIVRIKKAKDGTILSREEIKVPVGEDGQPLATGLSATSATLPSNSTTTTTTEAGTPVSESADTAGVAKSTETAAADAGLSEATNEVVASVTDATPKPAPVTEQAIERESIGLEVRGSVRDKATMFDSRHLEAIEAMQPMKEFQASKDVKKAPSGMTGAETEVAEELVTEVQPQAEEM